MDFLNIFLKLQFSLHSLFYCCLDVWRHMKGHLLFVFVGLSNQAQVINELVSMKHFTTIKVNLCKRCRPAEKCCQYCPHYQSYLPSTFILMFNYPTIFIFQKLLHNCKFQCTAPKKYLFIVSKVNKCTHFLHMRVV